ncbi:MAG: hypothetical protein GX213_13495 [Clostridiaceae bacterium]|nr:hypothetical protein [Clostridiaceae bacterium]
MVKIIPKSTKLLEWLAARNSLIYRAISLYYKKLVKKEVALANIKSTDKVLCIGGGPCPFSGILLHEYTGAPVTIIDKDARCVCVSRELIKKLGYDNAIKIILSDGNDIAPKDFSVIHMAAQVSPLDKVFLHLKQGCCFGARILVRLPKHRLSKFYSINEYSVFGNYYRKAVHKWRNVGSTALFIKS